MRAREIPCPKDGDVSNKARRYARTDEYLKVLRQEWTAEKPFDHDGDFYRIRGGFAAVKPQNLPVFFGGSSAEAIDVAGRHADVYALWGEMQELVRESVSAIPASAARYGRNPGFSLSLRPIIADTEEAAWKRADEIVEIVREIRDNPAQLASLNVTLFGRQAQRDLVVATPRTKTVLSNNWTSGHWHALGRLTRYGSYIESSNVPTGDRRFGAKWIADLDVGYDISDRVTLSAGANNLFDVYPQRNGLIAYDGSGAYGNFAPFGLSGGFYYGRVTVRI